MKPLIPQHFLDLADHSPAILARILKRAHQLKMSRGGVRKDLHGKTVALIFEKPSTRTRVSFEVAVKELGGQVVVLTAKEMQLGHSESIADTARVLSRFVHGVMIRTFGHATLLELAQYAGVPVINGLTNCSHPCQVMADLMTAEERFGSLAGLQVAWCGDGDNNVLTSWMQAATLFDFNLRIASPASLMPQASLEPYRGAVRWMEKPAEALAGADIVLTDTWVSMHQADAEARRAALAPYQITPASMALAKPKAIFMHCLPAHRGEEVVDAVLDGGQSAVWDEAENRLHVQKAILLWCFGRG